MVPAFDGLVDYAGLFPPASCTMTEATARYAEYRADPHRAMLGRFVVAATRLSELATLAAVTAGGPRPDDRWPLSVVLGPNMAPDAELMAAFRASPAAAALPVAAVELRANTPGEVGELASRLPTDIERYFEVPAEGPVSDLAVEIKLVGGGAKLRMGGTTPEAFPAPEAVVRFLLAVTRNRLPWKATAGLHHPFRGRYPLTYEPRAPRQLMYGWLNLFLAAAELARGGEGEVAQAILEEEAHGAFRRSEGAWHWQDLRWTDEDLRAVRTGGLRNFGSCSFREPVDEIAGSFR